jgi:hypothetical protein
MTISAIKSGPTTPVVSDSSKKNNGSGFQSALAAAQSSAPSPADEAAASAKMTPAQRLRADSLTKLSIKESDLDAMSPDQRKVMEDKIAEMIADAQAKSVPLMTKLSAPMSRPVIA